MARPARAVRQRPAVRTAGGTVTQLGTHPLGANGSGGGELSGALAAQTFIRQHPWSTSGPHRLGRVRPEAASQAQARDRRPSVFQGTELPRPEQARCRAVV